MRSEDLVWWALTLRIPDTDARIGSDRLSRTLAVLAAYANADGVAWPSAERLAQDLGIDRRTVRGALAALESAGLISRVPVQRTRSTAWTFAPVTAGDMAGIPANPALIHRAGIPASQVAGEVAGEVAGNMAGIPATKRREGNNKIATTTMNTVQPGARCAPGHHRLVADGTCMNCDMRTEDAA